MLSPAARLTREEPGPHWESPRQCKEQSCLVLRQSRRLHGGNNQVLLN